MLCLFANLLSFAKANSLKAAGNDIGYVVFNPGYYIVFYEIPAGITVKIGYNDFTNYFVLDTGIAGATMTVKNPSPASVRLRYDAFQVDYQCNQIRCIANPPYGNTITVSSSGNISLHDYENICLFYANSDLTLTNNLFSSNDVVYYSEYPYRHDTLSDMYTLRMGRSTSIDGSNGNNGNAIVVSGGSGSHLGSVTVFSNGNDGGTYMDTGNDGRIYHATLDDVVDPLTVFPETIALWIIIVIVVVAVIVVIIVITFICICCGCCPYCACCCCAGCCAGICVGCCCRNSEEAEKPIENQTIVVQNGAYPPPAYGQQPTYNQQPGYGQQYPPYQQQPGNGQQPAYPPQPGYGQPPSSQQQLGTGELKDDIPPA